MKLPKPSALLIVVIAGMGTPAGAEDVLSPCADRESALSTCSEFAAACVAYFKSPIAPTDTLRAQMGDIDVNYCVNRKNQCLNTGRWQGPNCIIINVDRR